MSLWQEVFTNLAVSLLVDSSKFFLSKIWNDNDNFNTLRGSLREKMMELQLSLEHIQSKQPTVFVSHTHISSDCLDELVWCYYEIEDTIHSLNLAISSNHGCLSTKMMQFNLERIGGLQTKLQDLETKLSNSRTNPDEASIGASRYVSPALQLLRSRDKEAIIGELKSHPIGVSILGIDGAGKTNLASSIVEDASIKEYFRCIVSAPPSHEFNLRSVLEQLNTIIPCDNTSILLLQLDGLQSVTAEDWHHFRYHCQQKLNLTIKFLITTQNPSVADVTATHKYCLPTLSPDDCFLLICNGAEANQNLDEYDLQAIKCNKKELVDTCMGLPLLAFHIGLLLSAQPPSKRKETVRAIATGSIWKQQSFERVLFNLTPVSMLAQKQHLQRCLAYCSLFPHGNDFIKDCLIQLWTMEGFTQLPNTINDACILKREAIRCFEDLVSYSIFQTSQVQPDEEPTYKIHQLLYDFEVRNRQINS